jgi:fatty-acyl-CoA synthase
LPDAVLRANTADTPASPLRSWDAARPARSTYELLSRAWANQPERIAVTVIPTGNPDDGDIRISRGALLARVNRAANLFASIGVGGDDSVATLLPSGIDALVVSYGAEAAGIIAPLNPMLRISELEHLIHLSGSRVLVASSDPDLGIWEKAEALAGRVPGLRLFNVGPAVAGVEDFNAACQGHSGDALRFSRTIEPSDIAAYIHTGGTTGMPKLACITHDNFIYGAWAQSRIWGFGETDVILSALPLFHVSGLATLATVPLSVGAEVVLLSASGFRNPQIVANFWRIVEKYRGSFSAFVPTIAATLTQIPADGANLSSLRTIMIGGAPAPADTLRRLKEHVPAKIVATFGQTECLVGTGNRPGHDIDVMSSGPAAAFMEVAIRAGAEGQNLPTGVPGDILLKGPAMFAGYKGRPADEGRTKDSWLITGDLGWLDEEGSLFVTGRSKDLIIRSGHNIDPRAIEEAGSSHPAVAACAAVGAPDRYAGELPVLYVALREGTEAAAEEIGEWVSARVGERSAAPKHVHILPTLPVTAVGKIYKPTLRLDAAERVARRELAGLLAEGAIERIAARLDDRRGVVIDIVGAPHHSAADVQSRAEALLAGFLLHVQVANSHLTA